MYLKNNTVCLITLNSPQIVTKDEEGKVVDVQPGESYQLLPAGDAIEVPDVIAKGDYAQALIKSGEIVVASTPSESKDDGLDELNDDELKAHAELMGVTIDKRWGRNKIVAEIRAAG